MSRSVCARLGLFSVTCIQRL